MENPPVAGGVTRIDYGSTAQLTASTSNVDNDDEICSTFAATRFVSRTVGYQHLSGSKGTTYTTVRGRNSFVMLGPRLSKMCAGTSSKGDEFTLVQRLEFLLNVLNQMCIGFVTIYMSWSCLRMNLAGTALHAWLVTIGFSFLMAEAVMCHYNGNVLTFSYKRNTKTTIHWVLQVLGGGCGAAGALIKMIQKGFLLKSIHGKLGFSAFVLCVISMLSGLSALFSMRVKKILSPLLNKTFHNLLGLAAFVIALAAQYYGYETGFFRRRISEDIQWPMKYATIISLILSSFGPVQALFNKCTSIVRQYS